ncbi:MAG: rhomboid family intramembrane serine protease [Bacteroidetes bacterium]|nr:rhomboid family intramembrane serine protease [Bacteroidota bacterium]
MAITGILVLLLIVANFIISYKGFTNDQFFDGYKFEVEKVLLYKDYKRLITGGFLHVGWMHLIFNMWSLYAFSGVVGAALDWYGFLLVYFASLVGGHLLSLFIHRHHGDYSAVGASGAICGVMFASVALFPGMSIGLFFISLPSWIYAILFVGFTIYGIRSKKNNVGYEAHLGGALIGMLLAIVMRPSAFLENYVVILIILVPSVLFIYLIVTRPETLLVDNLFFKTHEDMTIDHKYNIHRFDQQQEVDRILDKISKRGMGSLTKKERSTLEEYSKRGG